MVEIVGGQQSTKLNVKKDGRAQVTAVTHESLFVHSVEQGDAYAWASGTYDYAGGDTILFVENTSATQNLYVKGVWLSGDTDTRVVVHIPDDNVTTAGTAITGTNLNTLAGKTAQANGVRTETGNTQGNIIWSGEIMAADAPYWVEFQGAVCLKQNRGLGVDFVTDGAACDVTIIGFYVNKDEFLL